MSAHENYPEVPAAVANLVLPGTDRLPAGADVEAHTTLLARALDADPRLVTPVRDVLDRTASRPPTTLDELIAVADDHAEEFVFALHAAYYMADTVREALGYPGQQRQPIALATRDQVVSDDLVAPVLARGAVYVPTPDTTA